MPSASLGRGSVTLRPLQPADRPIVLSFALPEIGRTPYGVGARSALDAVLTGSDPDARALVAIHDARLVGIAVYSAIAGSVGASRLQLVVIDEDARRRGIATRLVRVAIAALGDERMRFVVAELPDDPALSASKQFLFRCRFRIEATVADYFRDGIDLAILRRDLIGG